MNAQRRRRVALYIRVSTDGQTTQNQLADLERVAEANNWNVVHVYRDQGVSGAKGRDERKGFNALCNAITAREVDMVAAWSVDRLSRSLSHLVGFMGELAAKNVDLYLHQQRIDTSTPAGKAMLQMMGVFAEFERSMIVERVKSGLTRARAEGVKLGAPRVAIAKQEKFLRLLRKGVLFAAAARQAGIGMSAAYRIKAEQEATS